MRNAELKSKPSATDISLYGNSVFCADAKALQSDTEAIPHSAFRIGLRRDKQVPYSPDGFICIDKPTGPSSFSAMRAIGKTLGTKKIGHAGTLDPMASGLLVVAAGKCTRLLQYLDLEPKEYDFSVVFGKYTDTLDAEGEVTAENDIIPSEYELAKIVKKFTGDIEQVPPAYSAIKIGGVPAYKMARKGVDVEMKPRRIHIYSLDMTGYDKNEKRADFTVGCSAGTYVRTLAADIAAAAGALGFVSKLRRTRAGRFDLSMAADQQFTGGTNYFINAWDVFDDGMKIIVTKDQISEISFGRKITLDRREKVLMAFDGDKKLSAVLRYVSDGIYQPERVFI